MVKGLYTLTGHPLQYLYTILCPKSFYTLIYPRGVNAKQPSTTIVKLG